MSYQFNHKPMGSLVGSGTYRFRHFGSEGYAITTNLTNCTKTSGPTEILPSGTATLVFTANSGYVLPSTITVTGATYTWTQSTGTLVLSNPTGNVSVSISAVVGSNIYGVQWDWSSGSSTVGTRTDTSASFVDPVPYVSGATSYSSPFDNLYPWNEMIRVTDSEAGELVKIPKFWYKWTISSGVIKLQIANYAATGFYVSPAHSDRGDGTGERDYVYIGRYHCSTSDYKSTTGVLPKASITRATARTAISALGDTIWQSDFQMRQTIQMLYLVEFADWNSQTKIGYGCGNGSSTSTMGYTDSMPYHTGTTQSSRTSYGLGTQYRYIEGLWDNVFDWCDGCYYNTSDYLLLINTPANFSDTTGGTSIGPLSNGYPSKFSAITANGCLYIYPRTSSGSDSTYCPDYWNVGDTAVCLRTGGGYSTGLSYGLFCIYRLTPDSTDTDTGCRLQKLP